MTEYGASMTALSSERFDSTSAEKRMTDLFKVGTMESFGQFSRAENSALGAIVEWLEITQKGRLPLLAPPVRESADGAMQIDAATRRNLELTRSMSGGRGGSLISVIDRTITAGGGRLLERRVSSPSRNLTAIHARQDGVSFMIEHKALAVNLRDDLRKSPDMDRAISRLGLDRGGPRDLTAIRDGLAQAGSIAGRTSGQDLPEILANAVAALRGHDDLLDLLDQALVADPPILARDGGFVAPGYHAELDEARTLRDEGRSVIAGMQKDFVKQTGIAALKIKIGRAHV